MKLNLLIPKTVFVIHYKAKMQCIKAFQASLILFENDVV